MTDGTHEQEVNEAAVGPSELNVGLGLWCLHFPGPDDVLAAPSKEAAEGAAETWNDTLGGDTRRMLRAEAIPWPHDNLSHARDLKNWEKWQPPIDA